MGRDTLDQHRILDARDDLQRSAAALAARPRYEGGEPGETNRQDCRFSRPQAAPKRWRTGMCAMKVEGLEHHSSALA
jgi:hypothetical protein